MIRILIATNGTFTNKVDLLDNLYREMYQIYQMKGSKLPFKVTRQKLLMECGDFFIDIRPVSFEKLAGIRFDYFLTDNPEAEEFLKQGYRGTRTDFQLYDTAGIIKLFIEYLDEQTINYKKIKLTKDDIIPIRDKFQSHVPDRCFDIKKLEAITSDISEQVKQTIHQYELKYKENLEMLGICELALLYLEEHKND